MQQSAQKLSNQGYHLIPIGQGKKPAIRWRTGQTDYVEVKPTAQEIRDWEPLATAGWGLLCGGPRRLVCIDVETAGITVCTPILRTLNGAAIRSTPSGGAHAWIHVVDGPIPGNDKLAYDADGTLLVETRGHGGYALIVGPGRPPLTNFQPQPLTFTEFRDLHNQLSSLNKQPEKPRPIPRPTGLRIPNTPLDTAEALHQMVTRNPETILKLLDPGWRAAGYDHAGRLNLTRPDYGNPTNEPNSANILNGTMVIWSSSVPWAPATGTPYTPADIYALACHNGDFAAAMTHLEHKAATHVA